MIVMDASNTPVHAISLRRVALSDHAITIAIFLCFAIVPVAAKFGAEGHLLSIFTRVMIFAIAVISLDLLIGYAGLVSFGHAAFIGLGVYTVGIFSAHNVTDLLIQFPAVIAVTAGFALLTGAISLRTTGINFIMITLAFGQMAFFVATSLAAYGGDDGLTLAAKSTLGGVPLFANAWSLYYVVFACLLAVFLLCRIMVASRFGRVLRGARENHARMEAIGFNPFPYRLTAYVIAGAIAGLSGVLLVNYAEFASPAYMTWQRSGELIIMVLLGRICGIHGAIVGATLYLLLEEYLSSLTVSWRIVFGLLLILIAIFSRDGFPRVLWRDR